MSRTGKAAAGFNGGREDALSAFDFEATSPLTRIGISVVSFSLVMETDWSATNTVLREKVPKLDLVLFDSTVPDFGAPWALFFYVDADVRLIFGAPGVEKMSGDDHLISSSGSSVATLPTGDALTTIGLETTGEWRLRSVPPLVPLRSLVLYPVKLFRGSIFRPVPIWL